ncbi:DEAD-box ATP-dependent RNA helicase FANCM isoform X2 [Salvia miltiorrhiza]|uniref:DEAD-box ATP-dependent RNA helicase FANCM isoform X2 n=1 Tax=Salvia miltiorrhiza TaxID=226208 RepID=UPI0025AB7C1E|nr:DEAD-box ATP-dependent RNA helicase FANCM isoform X2 [Salvia miltiorrhiza]
MVSASAPLQIMDDDDEFDWEAAVHEIDVACRATAAEMPTVVPDSNCKQEMFVNTDQAMRKKGKFEANLSSAPSTRQTTLDKFIGVSSCNSRKFEEKAGNSYGQLCMSNSIGNNICEETEKLNEFVSIDAEAAKTWIYPVNIPCRDYQLSITRTALFANTLVALPTGLGKTLIAAVVMYNFFRWFPEGKIVFAAPSRPLVMQQIEACHKIVGIPQEWTIDLTGQTSPSKRAEFWKCKRVFFVTPQVLEKDIQSGSCLVKNLVCLVIDEAHRATGNYSYCVAVRELMDASVQLRILALTATPGSKQQTIQRVIDNLQISTLEYRNESDPDVLPFVHERKIELIQVSMGDEAIEVDSLLLEVGRPFHARLCTFGLLPKRDIQTLSPCDYLKSREMFCEKPPAGFPQSRQGEFLGYFGALLTLHHLRKLLSSHGIRPAFEMIDEKLKQWQFARMVGRNEALLKAKLLMQKTVSHGAPSPKLAKMLEVLIDHFKAKDPKNSRVIIFSNFRGSVRDILDALKNIGEYVKATEFIGQSSGKTSKGQSQKVQQAVLQKFRTGGYNVIVATSIGEEGLDIMEVDLVICFDANVSPLRMIQRMGRTGRKNEGRVVVLACEGSELRGYMRKQANSRSINKHMINGGTNSFNFHPSPRMVPHSLKPELRRLEMSIEEYVPRGSKAKDSEPSPLPAYKDKITDAEKDLLAKYFVATQEDAWRPSLIAFPHFQAYPSPANDVLHSSRTLLLIDTMQHLQELTYSHDRNPSAEDDDVPDPCLRVLPVERQDNVIEDSERYMDRAEEESDKEAEGSGQELQETELQKPKTWLHTFLFASEFVSVDGVGNVLVLSLPQLPLGSSSKRTEVSNVASPYHLMQDYKGHAEIPLQPMDNHPLHPRPLDETVHEFSLSNPSAEDEKKFDMAEEILQSPVSSRMQNETDISDQDLIDIELSPRLTNFIKSGVVPESPINDSETWKGNRRDVLAVPALVSSLNLETERFLNSCEHKKKEHVNGSSEEMDILCLNDNGIQTPPLDCNTGAGGQCSSPVPVVKELQTPVTKLSNTSSSKDWLPDSGVQPESVEQQCKFRRLRKLGDCNRKFSTETRNQTGASEKFLTSRRADNHKSTKLLKGKKKQSEDAAAYIEEEAEVSSDATASDDEEDVQGGSSYEDSFIDDGLNSTTSNTQAGSSRVDMMAIYRRSLLSQSPFPRPPSFPANHSPDSVVQSSKMDGSGSSTGTRHNNAPQTGFESTARNNKDTSDGVPTEILESRSDSRKRKFSFHQAHSLPMLNLDREFSLLSGAARENSSVHVPVEMAGESIDVFEDDGFYEGIDLDALEEEATKLLKQKAECSTKKITGSSETNEQNLGILDIPSFDLGF